MSATFRPGEDHQPELLDRIDALRVFRADTPEEKARLLEEIGGTGKVEQDIVDQLSKIQPVVAATPVLGGAPDDDAVAGGARPKRCAPGADAASARATQADRRLHRAARHPLDRARLSEQPCRQCSQALRAPRSELDLGQRGTPAPPTCAHQRRPGRAGVEIAPHRLARVHRRRRGAVGTLLADRPRHIGRGREQRCAHRACAAGSRRPARTVVGRDQGSLDRPPADPAGHRAACAACSTTWSGRPATRPATGRTTSPCWRSSSSYWPRSAIPVIVSVIISST